MRINETAIWPEQGLLGKSGTKKGRDRLQKQHKKLQEDDLHE